MVGSFKSTSPLNVQVTNELTLPDTCKRAVDLHQDTASPSPSGPRTIHFRSSWVAIPTQNRSRFFPIYFFPRQVALEGRRRPPFVESLRGARHCAEHCTHWSDIGGTGCTWSPEPTALLFQGTQSDAVSPWWKVDEVVYITHKPGPKKPPSWLLSSLAHPPAAWWPLHDLDKLGLKLGGLYQSTSLNSASHIKLRHRHQTTEIWELFLIKPVSLANSFNLFQHLVKSHHSIYFTIFHFTN